MRGYSISGETVSSGIYYETEPDRGRERKHPVRTTVFVMLGILAVAGIAAGSYFFSLANTFNTETTPIESAFPEPATRPSRAPAAEGAMNILLMGSDIRAGSGESENLPDVPNGARSDTMMLMHIPKDRDDVYVMSIMRDTWTEIPGYGEHKINAAMSFGGVPLVVQTIEGMFHAPVDHVIIVDFEGFKGLTDALGGVEVNNPIAFQSEGLHGEFFVQGPVTLDGDSALKFVRERYAFTDGDYQRVKNQQLFIKGVMSQLLRADTLTNPLKISDVVRQISPYLSVDEDFNAGTAASLALSLRSVRADDVHFFTLPNLGIGTSLDGQSIVLKDDTAIAEIVDALDTDSLGEYLESSHTEDQDVQG